MELLQELFKFSASLFLSLQRSNRKKKKPTQNLICCWKLWTSGTEVTMETNQKMLLAFILKDMLFILKYTGYFISSCYKKHTRPHCLEKDRTFFRFVYCEHLTPFCTESFPLFSLIFHEQVRVNKKTIKI